MEDTSTIYIPIASPPTPAPSPRPTFAVFSPIALFTSSASPDPALLARREFASIPAALRRQFLASLIADCTPGELLFISTTIAPRLKRDFLRELPTEIALHVLSFVDDPITLARTGRVSRYWRNLTTDEWIWRRMCDLHGFPLAYERLIAQGSTTEEAESSTSCRRYSTGSTPLGAIIPLPDPIISYRAHFRHAYITGTFICVGIDCFLALSCTWDMYIRLASLLWYAMYIFS